MHSLLRFVVFCFLAFCHIFKSINLNTAAEETAREHVVL